VFGGIEQRIQALMNEIALYKIEITRIKDAVEYKNQIPPDINSSR